MPNIRLFVLGVVALLASFALAAPVAWEQPNPALLERLQTTLETKHDGACIPEATNTIQTRLGFSLALRLVKEYQQEGDKVQWRVYREGGAVYTEVWGAEPGGDRYMILFTHTPGKFDTSMAGCYYIPLNTPKA